MKKKHFLVVIGIAISLLLVTVMPSEAKWPTKPIIIVVPWGATNDPSTIVSNAMISVLEKDLGVPVKVINKSGGRGILGTNFVATSKTRRLYIGPFVHWPHVDSAKSGE